jgi:hypothetical protein
MATTFQREIKVKPRDRIDTIRLLLHDADVLDDLSDGWELLWETLSREWMTTDNESYVSEWILHFYSFELRNNPNLFRVAWLLISLVHCEKKHLMQIFLETGIDIRNAVYENFGFSPLHGIVAEGLPLAVIPSLKLMTEKGADLHLTGRTNGFKVQGISAPETPTSVAMRRSETFLRWQQFLKDIGCDLSEFATKELEAGALANVGWTLETLTLLLRLKFEPASLRQAVCICGRVVHQVYGVEELWWVEILTRIREGATISQRDLEMKRESFEEPEDLCWVCSEQGMVQGGQWSPSATRRAKK